MVKFCSVESCKNVAEGYCDCKSSNYFCSKHLISHMKQIGAHIFSSVFIDIEDKYKKAMLKDINEKLTFLKQSKIAMKKMCSEIMSTIISKCNKTLEKITEEQNHYRSLIKIIITRSEIERELHKQVIQLQERNQIILPSNLTEINQEINQLFDTNFKLSRQGQDDDDYFWIQSQNLIKINLKTLKRTQSLLTFNLQNTILSCKLPNMKFFVTTQNSENCYIADLQANTLVQLPNSGAHPQYSALCCIGDSVYIIEGSTIQKKFNILTRKWSNISKNPLPRAHTIGGRVLDKMCIASTSGGNGYIYDPNTSKYSSIISLPGGNIIIGHGFILSPNNFYKMQDNDPYKWEMLNYGNSNMGYNMRSINQMCCYCMMNSYVFKREKYIYFCSCDETLFRFDTENYLYERVSYSY